MEDMSIIKRLCALERSVCTLNDLVEVATTMDMWEQGGGQRTTVDIREVLESLLTHLNISSRKVSGSIKFT